MKCPWMTIILHEPETPYTVAQDVTAFGECYRGECPFYKRGKCKRVENETDKKRTGNV